MPLTPTDDIIGPTATTLAGYLQTQITGLGRVYTTVPDGPVEDNSVLMPVVSYKLECDTIGKIYVRITWGIRYVVRRTSVFSSDMLRLYAMFSAFCKVLSSWDNQFANGLQITVTPTHGGFTQLTESGTAYVAFILNTDTLTEFNILTTNP